MNAESFTEYLVNPSKLYQIPYQELKSLVYQYPYCQNLRCLLLKKSKLEGHKDFEKNLQLAATCSLDRGYLFQQLEQLQPLEEGGESYVIKEDYLELKDLSARPDTPDDKILLPPIELVFEGQDAPEPNEPEKEKLEFPEEEPVAEHQPDPIPELEMAPVKPQMNTSKEESIDPDIEELFDFEEDEEEPIVLKKEAPKVVEGTLWDLFLQAFPSGQMVEQFDTASPIEVVTAGLAAIDWVYINQLEKKNPLALDSEKLQQIAVKKVAAMKKNFPSPAPKTSFSSWLKQFQSPKLSIRSEEVEAQEDTPQPKKDVDIKKKKKSSKKQRIKSIAKSSVTESEEIATETLAKILVMQENYSKALRMYRRLGEIYPEKKASYEKIIDDLEKMI